MPNHSEQKPFIGRFSNLPSPPAILIELIDSCNNPDVSFAQLAETIRKDAGVSSQVITAANSPFYRQWKEISDLQRLLVVLGIRSVRTIAINSAVQQFFAKLSKQTGRVLDKIWYQSLMCAETARSLAELSTYPNPEEAYLAGLLHRLGQLALLQAFPDDYKAILDKGLEGEALVAAEKEMLDFTSPQVGSQMIDSWELQSFLSDAVLYQYEPADTILDSSHLVKLINLASQLSASDVKPGNEALERADLLFGLNQAIIEERLQEAQEKAAKAAQSLGIALPSQKSDQHAQRHQDALAERVKQAALFGGGLEPMPEKPDMIATMQQIQRDLDLLFGIKQICFLLQEQDGTALHPVSPTTTKSNLLDGITLSTASDRSLAASAFNQKKVLFSQDEENQALVTVVDHQLARFLKSDGILYLPLSSQQSTQGLIVVGMSQHQWQSLSSQHPLLTLFAREAAEMLQRQHNMLTSQQQMIDEERAAFHLEARKVVHEVNNPLGIINNYLHILGMKLGEDHQVREELDIIKEEISRVGKIILRVRDIPDELEQQVNSVDINQLIQDLNKLFQSSLFTTHNIVTELDLDSNIPQLGTRRGHLKQILTNLIKNAVEAMPEGGKLSIASRDNAYLNGKAHIEIQITDNGPGIDREIMDQLFFPGKTTKDSSHSGLGLAIVKNLIDELSGSINCTSNTESGTRFQLFLPRVG
ncbi:MAG: HDOD domain-containing protein [Candidatus Thiodiazotropha sp. (ex Lucinoma borealis)]|nr:HDOD domain-containing protein [Candidatus Thiodiazotropha sp. (ex Lucinoma borealis)]